MNNDDIDEPRDAERSTPDRWPVVVELPLPRAEKRWWRRYRSPDLLPMLRPGCVYVFAVGGQHEICTDAGALRGNEPMLVDASSLSVVNTRSRRFTVWARIPTTEAMADLALGVTFRCTVTDARAVARDGLVDLRGEVENDVRHLPELREFWHRFAPDAVADAHATIAQTIGEHYTVSKLAVHGVQVEFVGATITPSRALHRHQTQMRDINWSHIEEIERVKKVHHDLLNSPERAEATAVTRNERTADQVATRQFTDRDTQTERLVAQVKEWLGSDAAKRAPVDRRQLAEALFARLIDQPNPTGHATTGLVDLPETNNGKPEPDALTHIAPDGLGEEGT